MGLRETCRRLICSYQRSCFCSMESLDLMFMTELHFCKAIVVVSETTYLWYGSAQVNSADCKYLFISLWVHWSPGGDWRRWPGFVLLMIGRPSVNTTSSHGPSPPPTTPPTHTHTYTHAHKHTHTNTHTSSQVFPELKMCCLVYQRTYMTRRNSAIHSVCKNVCSQRP